MSTTGRALPKPVIDVTAKVAGAVSIGEIDGGLPAAEGTVERRGLSWRLQVVSYPGEVLVARSYLREAMPSERREAAAVFANRINWALLVGDVEVDRSDGTVRVRTVLCPQGASVSSPLAEGLIAPNVGTAQLVLPALLEVAAGQDPDLAADALLDTIEAEGIDLSLV